jgi:hypothetical protein
MDDLLEANSYIVLTKNQICDVGIKNKRNNLQLMIARSESFNNNIIYKKREGGPSSSSDLPFAAAASCAAFAAKSR